MRLRYRAPMFLLLSGLACTAPSGEEESVQAPPAGSCDRLAAPLSIEDADDVSAAYALYVPMAVRAHDYIDPIEDMEPGVCPLDLVVAGQGYTADFGDGCTTNAGASFSGRVEITDLPDGELWTFEAFELHYAGADGTIDFTADGSGSFSSWDTGSNVAESATWSYAATGDRVERDVPQGEFAQDYSGAFDDGSLDVEAYRRVFVSEELPVGDSCVVVEGSTVDRCDEEWDAVVRIAGTRTAVVTLDGSTACDGCGETTLDGASIGQVCL